MRYKHSILTAAKIEVSSFQKDPVSALVLGEGEPIAIVENQQPLFYAVPVEAFEAILDDLDDAQVARSWRKQLERSDIRVQRNQVDTNLSD